MAVRPYPWLDDLVAALVLRQQLHRFQRSTIVQGLSLNKVVLHRLSDLGLHDPDAQDMFLAHLPVRVSGYLASITRRNEIPNGKPIYIRLYPSFVYQGDRMFQHLSGIAGDPEAAKAVWASKALNLARVARQHKFWGSVVAAVTKQHSSGVDIDWDWVIADYVAQGGH